MKDSDFCEMYPFYLIIASDENFKSYAIPHYLYQACVDDLDFYFVNPSFTFTIVEV